MACRIHLTNQLKRRFRGLAKGHPAPVIVLQNLLHERIIVHTLVSRVFKKPGLATHGVCKHSCPHPHVCTCTAFGMAHTLSGVVVGLMESLWV
jgi:hypothetical protein